MTIRTTPFAAGTPCWVDLFSSDVDKSGRFYDALFGWHHEPGNPEYGGYTSFTSDGHVVAGLMGGNTGENGPDSWTTYLSTDNIEASVATAVAAGGAVVSDSMQVGGQGSMAVLTDPTGGVFGFWQPAGHTGFGKYNEPGSVAWDEHHSTDFAATTAFYAEVAGWEMQKMADTDEFRYFNGQVDGQEVAGMMDSASFLPEGVSSHWVVYFSVEDTDAVVAKTLELGGSVVRPAEDSPFGRIADLRDSTGAGFKVVANLAMAPVE